MSALLAILANISFGASVVAMNAYLPALAKSSPEVALALREAEEEPVSGVSDFASEDDVYNQGSPLLPQQPQDDITQTSRRKYDAILSAATSRISSLGIALGYAAGIILLILALIPVTSLGGSTFSLRLAIGLSGIWCGNYQYRYTIII